ncbi:MAG TPA: hypothetical protein VG797_02305 [Phycisphaerales bacterium]|nr:hypothetical protein [Phycisphaerales bacterium]
MRITRALVIATLTAAAVSPLPAPLLAGDPEPTAAPAQREPAPRVTVEQAKAFIRYYYLDRKPEQVPENIRALLSVKHSENDQILYSSALVPLFRQNPKEVGAWAREIFPRLALNRRQFWNALWMANTDQARAALGAVRELAEDQEQPQIEALLKTPPPNVLTTRFKQPFDITVMWGCFYTSGDERFVVRIIDALAGLDESETDGNRKAIAVTAQHTLIENAWAHSKVLAICKDQESKQPAIVAPHLNEIVVTAMAKLDEAPCPEPQPPQQNPAE